MVGSSDSSVDGGRHNGGNQYENGISNDIMSDRFTIMDNRWTASMASALYTVQCHFVSDTYDEQMQVRAESIAHSNSLPAGNVTTADITEKF